MASPQSLTQLLLSWNKGDKTALDEMMPLVYDELRRIARSYLRRERPDHTLQPTALVHEAYLRLVDQHAVDWKNRAQFLGVAAQMMRRILVNHANRRQAGKRGGSALTLSLDHAVNLLVERDLSVVALDRALTALAAIDPQQSRIVELRFFGGLTLEEVAEVVGVSLATVKREWSTARLWLRRQLSQEDRNS